jgi:hypothetical protein
VNRNPLRPAAALAVAALLSPAAALSDDAAARAASQGREGSDECAASYSLFNPQPRSCFGPIDTDRPHLTDTPHTIPPGHFQLEAELANMGTSRQRPVAIPSSVQLMDMLFKLGVVSGVDLQLGYTSLTLTEAAPRWLSSAGHEVFLRAKVNVFGGNEGAVSLTIAPLVWIPTDGRSGVEGGGTLLLGAELAHDLELEVNVSAIAERRDAGGRQLMVASSAAVTRRIYGPVSAFGELYNQYRNTASDQLTWYGCTGALFQVGQNMQADLGVRLGLTRFEHPVTAFVGYSLLL